MGNNPPKKNAPQPTIDDVILDMRLTVKRFENEARRCEKEKQTLLNKSKQALQKNNEEGARLFMTSAINKQKEGENLQRMAHKMDCLQGQIRSTSNQTATMASLNKISPLLQQQVHQMPVEQLYATMNQFESAMDEITVQGKIMDGMMNKNQDFGQDQAVDDMMIKLKQEMNNQISNDLNANNQLLFNELNQPQTQQQQNQLHLNNQQYK